MKKIVVLSMLLGSLVSLAAPVAAAGIAGAGVQLVDTGTSLPVASAVTDADGAFLMENVPAGSYRLDAATADTLRSAALAVAVAIADAPARVRGQVTEDSLATTSFAVAAFVTAMSAADVVFADGYPRLQPKWNVNWAHASGRTAVRLAGTGLETLAQVTLTSALGTIATSTFVVDPDTGVIRAVFPKAAAFTTLAGPDAKRGDVLALEVGVTTATGTVFVDTTVQIVGRRR